MRKAIALFFLVSFVATAFTATVTAALPKLPKAALLSDRLALGQGESFFLGIYIPLGPEWKTYGPRPGDGGLPPSFDWSQSQNLSKIQIVYPATEEFHFGEIRSHGYSQAVVFPVTVVPQNPALPLVVRLDFSYGICGYQICVPRKERLVLTVPPGEAHPSPQRDLITAYLNPE